MPQSSTARLLIAAPDRPGLAAAITGFVAQHGGSIVDADQHTDEEAGAFFQRIEFRLDGFDLDRPRLPAALRPVTEPLGMQWQLRFSDEVRRIAVLASRRVHCLYDLLGRAATGDLPGQIAFVASNTAIVPRRPHVSECPSTTYRYPRPTGTDKKGNWRTYWKPPASSWSCWPGTCRSCPRRSSSASRHQSSTSTIPSCPRSSAGGRITRPTNEGSRSSASPPTTPPPIWTRGRSSTRTSPG
jgi:predicted amino acid-binding ACT domain protein